MYVMASNRPDEAGSNQLQRVSDATGREFGRTGLRRRLHEVRTWVMVDVSRWLLIVALAAVTFVVTVLVGVLGPVSVQQAFIEGTVINNAYVDLQTAIVTVGVIALTINQLVLAPELGPLSRQRKRLNDALSNQNELENAADIAVSPQEPAQFLRTIAETAGNRATELERDCETLDDAELRQRVREYTDRLKEDTDRITRTLTNHRFGGIGMVGAVRHLDISREIAAVRRLRNEADGELPNAAHKSFDDLLDILKQFAITRQYFDTLYIRMEFANFSHALLYTLLPALLVAHYTVYIIGPNTFPGTTLGIRNLLWYEAAAFTVSILPVLVLITYVARLSTLGKLTTLVSLFSERRS